jgi:hypothetical protein
MYNVSVEPDKFVPALITYLTTKGYSGLYLTDRDPEKEIRDDYTDIEWHYVVTLGNDFGKKANLDTYYNDYDKKKFIKKAGSMKSLVEAERRASEAYRRKTEKERGTKTIVVARKRTATRKGTGATGLGTIK